MNTVETLAGGRYIYHHTGHPGGHTSALVTTLVIVGALALMLAIAVYAYRKQSRIDRG